ncbi:RNA polymerase, sigma-24 subunit, ECF subfamily [Hymenobacter roseosalivarius DSM 11622]|uniref:RNA polymerase, sigma-24 subunit, ECF subfamily n=1 Tax=Hymenobacter roseosalivarius DSM 11622 TaxID=645990 RepID=A0A1W1US83_9BACT|nr:RNA polymerase sigma-70 factor [Hymenobacter roseosalivarius]SMB83869.1 RNA polymerase, sigma-24 subunit, ECF subfamily [Hymenobacter roseosalivarius DSM 11622]
MPENLEELTRFEELFRRNYPRLCQRVQRITRDLAVAEDIVQEVFVSYWHSEQRPTIENPEAWLYKAVINKALNAASVQQRRNVLTIHYGAQQPLTTSSADQALQLEELQQQLEQTLTTLPPMCRKVFLLSRYEEMSHQEIADFLGISPNTVDNHIKKALAILRQALLNWLLLFLVS